MIMKGHFLVGILAVVLLCIIEGQTQNNNGNRFNNNNNNGGFRPNNGNRFNNNNNNNRFNNNRANNGRAVNNNNNNNRVNNNVRRPVNNVQNTRPVAAAAVVNNNNNNNNNFRATPATARDAKGFEVYPGCNGTVCLPDANLCAQRKQKVGHFNFGRKSYWISWASDESALRNARWNWFTGRNYCRMMCMDMISLETAEEQSFVGRLMSTSNIDNVHTAGRLCDAEVEGCNQTRFQPLNVNGWFWASTLKMMPPTNVISNRFFNNWAATGAKGQAQPDGALRSDGFGNEACMALVNNQNFGGLKWHDEPCNTRRQLICEDLPTPNINFVRNANPNVNIP